MMRDASTRCLAINVLQTKEKKCLQEKLFRLGNTIDRPKGSNTDEVKLSFPDKTLEFRRLYG